MHLQRASRLTRTLLSAAVAVPVLLAAGCSSDDSGGSDEDAKAKPSSKPSASLEPARFKKLPPVCESLTKGTVEDVVPGVDKAKGKNLGPKDGDSYGSCIWTGLKEYDYRSLTLSMRRFDSHATLGSADARAKKFLSQQVAATRSDKSNDSLDEKPLKGVGDEATSLEYKTKEKYGKSKEEHRLNKLVVRSANTVLTVDYGGAGFEDGKLPKAEDLRKGAEKAAKEALSSLG
ncbi:DUF3558 domain-containing protein [Streptomyces sp. NPDC005438]|uniref:DUF3558 domain-containing protein n=1 Tax=Streptomyces sp. NPDC005438 TaxID=3156880 RepID=UPI0033B19559